MLVLSWVAVTWHRFILLEEYPAYFPAVTGRPIWRVFPSDCDDYFADVWRFDASCAHCHAADGRPFGEPALCWRSFLFACMFCLVYVWLRVCISLPSVAVGEPMTSVEAWGKTREISQTILGLGLVMILLNFAAGTIVTSRWPQSLSFPQSPVLPCSG